jgi:hypothetical protein
VLLIDYLALKIGVLLCQSAFTITNVHRTLGNAFDHALFINVCDRLPKFDGVQLLSFRRSSSDNHFCIPFAAHVLKRFEPSQDLAG